MLSFNSTCWAPSLVDCEGTPQSILAKVAVPLLYIRPHLIARQKGQRVRILVTGANGFIGAHIVAALLRDGHHVVGGVRQPDRFTRRFPSAEAIQTDFRYLRDPAQWAEPLTAVDAVVNCAGVLSGPDLEAVHVDGAKALFDGAVLAGVGKLIHISAISADPEAGTDYARSKHTADKYLETCDLDWTILRPSLVYAAGAYGGTALLRALAALPLAIPLVGRGDQAFQPIHAADVARTVVQALTDPKLSRKTIEPVGPDTLTLQEILVALRGWLGLPRAPAVAVPLPLVDLAAAIGGLAGRGPLNPTAVRQLNHGNVGNPGAFTATVGWTPRRFAAALEDTPAQTQDLWHARIYFLAPLLKYALALLWLGSGIAGLFSGTETAIELFGAIGLPISWALPATIAFSVVDLVIAGLIVSGRWIGAVCGLQVTLILAYTIILSATYPGLWLDPFGPLLKNIPVLAAILVYGAIGRAR